VLSGDDDKHRLDYQFQYNPVDLDVSQEAYIPLMVRTKRHLLGKARHVPFQLYARPIDNPPTQTVSGEFVSKPILPVWIVPAIAAVLAFGLVASSFLGLWPLHGVMGKTTPSVAIRTSSVPPTVTRSSALTPTPSGDPSPSVSPTSTAHPGLTPTPVQLPVAHNTSLVASGLSAPLGAQYIASQDSLYFVEYSGNLSVLRNISSGKPSYSVVGTGYSALEDLYVASDGNTVYLTERSEAGGALLEAKLSAGANRSQAQIIASGLNAPQQVTVDETGNVAYVAEFTDGSYIGSVVKVDLGNGSVTTVLNNLQNPIGVLFSSADNSLYVTEQLSDGSGNLSRYNLAAPHTGTLLASDTARLFFLSWANTSQSMLLVSEREPVNQVWYMDLTQSSPSLQSVKKVSSVQGYGPSSAVVASSSGFFPMLVCASEIYELT
jgi:eukaryotic-like serine/threonine-protein kinase